MKKILFYSWCILLIIITSCSKKSNYEFRIYNQTKYKINSFNLGNGENKVTIAIEKNDSSNIIMYSFDGTYFNVAETSLDLSVSKYSDNNTTYSNSIGHLTSISNLNKEALNTIKIILRNNIDNETDIFYFEVNK